MNAWLDANADGLALMFWACIAGLVILTLAALVEYCMAYGMRRRAAQREAYRRYCESIIDRCWSGPR